MSGNIDLQQLAFAYASILRVIRSDTVLDPAEVQYLHGQFPMSLLQSCGFLDAAGRLTEHYSQTLAEAQQALPGALTVGQKLALMDILVQAAASDGVLAAEEADHLFDASRQLGLQDDAWRTHLDSLIASGQLRRDDAGV